MARTHRPELTPTTRGRIYQCILNKDTYRSIAKQFKVSLGEVSSLKKRYEERGHLRTIHRSGRPPSMTPHDDQHTASLIRRHKARNATDIQRNFYKGVSVWTIRRALHRAGLRACSPRKVPSLTPLQRRIRKVWALGFRDWDFTNWTKMFFSDEVKYNLYRSDGRDLVWRERGWAYDPRYTIKTKKFGGGSVMCWGCITPWGVGKLHRITSIMDRHVFIQVISESLLGTLEMYHLRPQDIFFQQDNDPKHTSKDARAWFAQKCIKLLPWPAQSPDLNPIENVWDYLGRRISKREVQPSNTEELWQSLQEEWYNIGPDFIQRLYKSMPRRLEMVIKAKGWNIPY